MASYNRGPPQQQYGPTGTGGSVRRARERVQAMTPSGLPVSIGQPETPESSAKAFREPRTAPTPPSNDSSRSRGTLPAVLQSAGGRGQRSAGAVSRPTAQSPQWPLNGSTMSSTNMNRNMQNNVPNGPPNNAPPRPPQPRYPPPVFDNFDQEDVSQLQDRSYIQPSRQRDNNPNSPEVYSPQTPVSRPTTISSVGSIPDFPIPIQSNNPAGAARRSAHLGPPPSARRGASSYYSNVSYVSPILEESDRSRSHGSYASSNAIPSSWGDESPGFQFYDRDDPSIAEDIMEDRESRDSTIYDNEEQGLVRSASIGRRGKPSMITTKSSEKSEQLPRGAVGDKDDTDQILLSMLGPPARPQTSAIQPGGSVQTEWPIQSGSSAPPFVGGTGLLDPSTSSSETVPTITRTTTTSGSTTSAMPQEPRNKHMLGVQEIPNGLGGSEPESRGFSRLSAIRRPPRLNIDAVRDAEARGSLTSLPDLIRRATRLAAMMDNGKRPASRLNDLSAFSSTEELGWGKRSESKRNSGLSGMLAAFPPPGAATPTGEPVRPPSAWPTVYDPQDPHSNFVPEKGNVVPKTGRRCCGLPVWGFLLMLLISGAIIAAAVVVPLELFVFRKQSAGTAVAQSDLSSCQASITCSNGGTAVVISGVCSCLCTNGFTGSRCTTAGADGCTTTNLVSASSSSALNNVTLGSAIPRLISEARTNFSIPLAAENILARFSAADLSCSSENALVTFDGFATREGSAQTEAYPANNATSSSVAANEKREEIATIVTPGATISFVTTAAYSSTSINPVITFDTRTMSFTSKSTATPAAASATTSGVSSASPTSTAPASFVVTQETLDFARVVTLYVLQQESLDAAISAQNAMQTFFSGGANTLTQSKAGNLTLGTGVDKQIMTVDFVELSLDLGNGTLGGPTRTTTSEKQRRGVRQRREQPFVLGRGVTRNGS